MWGPWTTTAASQHYDKQYHNDKNGHWRRREREPSYQLYHICRSRAMQYISVALQGQAKCCHCQYQENMKK